MWCCFKVPETLEEVVYLETPVSDVPVPVPDVPVPVPETLIEPFILDHSTISMTECEKPIN